jgi:hypothetical protein
LKRAYFRRIMWDMGEGQALAAVDPPPGPLLAGVPRWRFRYVARLFARGAFRTIGRKPRAFEDALHCVMEAGAIWGQMKRAIRDRRERRAPERSHGLSRGERTP